MMKVFPSDEIILEPAKILRENPHTKRPYGSKTFFIRGKIFHHIWGPSLEGNTTKLFAFQPRLGRWL